jgi:hypothetical protein
LGRRGTAHRSAGNKSKKCATGTQTHERHIRPPQKNRRLACSRRGLAKIAIAW